MISLSGMCTFGPHQSIKRCRGPTNPTALPTQVDYSTQGWVDHLPDHCEEDVSVYTTQSEVFLQTHTKKKDRGQFVDEHSQ
ncbi:hypothetical protein PIB30_089737 [Stylosanthes scabra]|uniref:Uncharacterized protein n=1 Tax=Stylosanthes scabra TaxID=79078 RepID=A0ABU6RU03_9FABA|nr:hypothetical protein [Stylosanthes scabra]